MFDPRKQEPARPKPRQFTVFPILLPVILIGLLIFSVWNYGAGNTAAFRFSLVLFIVLAVVVLPSMGLARFMFRGRLGKILRGDDTYTPVYTSKRFSFFIRHHNRPWWITLLLYLLGWVLIIFIFVLIAILK